MLYDTIIVGAGVAGCSCAYFLKKKNQTVLLLDKNGIASGGSGAAGAFFSPKVGVDLPLKKLGDEAFLFAHELYTKEFSDFFDECGIERLPKNQSDKVKFQKYQKFITICHTIRDDTFFFPQGGVCQPKEICEKMADGVDFGICEITKIEKIDGFWSVGAYRAKNLILATGYENKLVDMRYMSIEGIWGNRADIKSSLPLTHAIHRDISLSPNRNGIIKIGATHELGVKNPVACSQKSVESLIQKAYSMVDASDFEIERIFCGMRASNRDYTPTVGKVVDVEAMLSKPNILDGRKYPLVHLENLFVLNALGARGFVFAPYCANELAGHIVNGQDIDERINPDRLFWNWVRKSNH